MKLLNMLRTPQFIVAALIALLAISLLGASWDQHQSALDPKGPIAQDQYNTFMLTLWVTTFLFVTVGGALAYSVIKFRMKPGDENGPLPKQSHGSIFVELGLIGFSAVMLLIIAVPTLRGIVFMKKVPEAYAADAIEITVTGYQWWWEFEYLDEGGLITANEMVFPVGRAIKLNLVTDDVIHSFWLPKLAGKTDLMPGQVNNMWILADEPGTYWGQCAEFCGEAHAYMLFRAHAVSEAEYAQWLEAQKQSPKRNEDGTPALEKGRYTTSEIETIHRGQKLYNQHCATCHRNDPYQIGNKAPNLAHLASRETLAAGWMENTAENLHEWIQHSETIKPGNLMYYGVGNMAGLRDQQIASETNPKPLVLSDRNVDAIVAYLQTLK